MGKKLKEVDKKRRSMLCLWLFWVCHDRCVYGADYAKKLSPFTSLILVPIAFGLLAGYGWDTLSMPWTESKCSIHIFNDDVCNLYFRGYAHRRYV